MRKILSLIIISIALAALVPMVPEAQALVQRWVEPTGTDRAKYTITTTQGSGLVECWLVGNLQLRRNRTNLNTTSFRCINNYSTAVVLNWSVANDFDGIGLTASGSSSIPVSTGTATCVSVTYNTPNLNDGGLAHPVLFAGKTAAAANFYVEIYFSGNVVMAGGNSNAC